MTEAIWRGDVATVRQLIAEEPRLLVEDVRGLAENPDPPMSYAAGLGQNSIIEALHDLGATDVQPAFDRACLQGRIGTARRLHALGARPAPGAVMKPCETLSDSGLALALELGAELADEHGDRLAPVARILETYARDPRGKRRCLELVAGQGIELPDTAPMAVHRGRIDLLEGQLRRDPALLNRTFSHGEIYPAELRCHADPTLALHGTPLAGTTLLHLCIDTDEFEMARWLIEQGADVNTPAEVDEDRFGGHTALFACVVSQTFCVGQRIDDHFAHLLLDHGADPNVRASLRKRLRFIDDEATYEYRDVTPLAWGQQFHHQSWVSRPVMRLLAQRGAHV
jgi:hypothetical protein